MSAQYNPLYLTYADYVSLGGTLEEGEFNPLEFKAETKVNWYTFNRLARDTEFDNRVPLCVKAIIDILQRLENAKNGLNADGSVSIVKQSNDGVSTDYNALSPSETIDKAEKEIAETIEQYLYKVKNKAGKIVLYRGIYADE